MTPVKGYTEMKDSGIDWIGEIPSHWKIGKVKNIFAATKTIVGNDVDSYQRLALTLNGVVKRSKTDDTGLQPEKFETYQILRQNELVFKLIDLQNVSTSRVGRSSYDGIVSPAYIVLHEMSKRSTKYAEYFFLAMWMHQIFNQLGADGVRSNIGTSALLNLPFIIVPDDEQSAIAAYLDTQCAKIDEIIAQAKASIEDYKQWKASIIYEAVTKGLDPNVEMKDSGIEWIGRMPKHWQDINPKALFSQRKERANPGDRQLTASQQFGVIYQVEYMELTGTKVVTVEKDFDILKHVSAGDFVISMRSFQGGLEYSTKSGSISSAYVMLVPNLKLVYPRYYRWLLKSNGYIRALQSTSDLVRDGQAMRYSNFAKVRLINPPLGEQEQIANYLDTQCAKIDTLMTEKQSLIDDLESYKKSLIYEVVTGKRRVADTSETTIAILTPEILRYRKALLMLRVLDLLGDDTRGRIQLQKCMFAAECLLNMPFHTQYVRYEHGPYDPHLQSFETILSSNGWYTVLQGSPVTYQKGKRFEEGLKEYMNAYSDIDSKLKKIVDFLRPMKTSQAERVATLLAVWNDYILDGIPQPSDKEIIDEVVTHWTPNKSNPQYSTWQDTLCKMRKNQFIPKGTGVHTLQKNS